MFRSIPRRNLLLAGAAGTTALLTRLLRPARGESASESVNSSATSSESASPLIAVLSAYPPETKANEEIFLGANQPVSTTVINGATFKQTQFEGHNLLLFSAGMSMVNAAMTTQLALSHFPISHVLFAGVAGGINPAYDIGDIVIPEQWHHHSEAVYANRREDGAYLLPDYYQQKAENFEFIFPDYVMVIRDGMDEAQEQASFAADAQLLELAKQVNFPTLACSLPEEASESRNCRVSIGGNGISGPVFLDHRGYREWAFRVWQAQCVDMESTAIAQVCWANQKPFLIVRGLSDLAGGQEGANPIDYTEHQVAQSAAIVLREIVRKMI
jgi:adenosylhomocysteine nucleosidase